MTRYEDLPYRPCVGVMLINKKGLVFIGRRTEGPEHVDDKHAWQMPQGGVDAKEDPWPAALRELYEETNVTSVEKLAESKSWYAYDIPVAIASKAWKGKYRGQTQKWYALRFTGKDSEIDVLQPAGGHKPEFAEWRWEKPERLPKLVVPFKRDVYEQVLVEFAEFARSKNRAGSVRRRR
jgi:putative (di)nucleoside polyphosphate hydrolase